ncbi:MAG TPA: hypothetical protein VIU61_16135, partial [Kofleriaceae bacterium]
ARRAIMYRLFKVGKMPVDVRAQTAGAILVEEGVPMTLRRKNVRARRPEGPYFHGGVRLEAGSFAVWPGRLLIGFRGLVIDATLGEGDHGEVVVGDDSFELAVDIGKLFPDASGWFRVTIKWPLPGEVRAKLPSTTKLTVKTSERIFKMP